MKFVIIVAIVVLAYLMVPAILREAGKAAGYSGNFKKALKLTKIAVKLKDNAKNKTMYGYMLMQNSMYKDAIVVFNEIAMDKTIKQADKLTAKVYRSMAKNKLGDKEGALEDAEDMFAVVKNTLTYSLLGYMRQSSGDASLDFCLEAYDYNSDDRDICDNLAVAYMMSGDLESAENIAKEEREKYPMFVEGFFHSAQIAAKRGDKKTALEYLAEIQNCRRTAMTTISEADVEALKEELENA